MTDPVKEVTFEELQAQSDNANLVRKIQQALVFLAPMDTELPTKMTGKEHKLRELQKGFFPIGMFTTDGINISTEAESEGVKAFGYGSDVRTDKKSESNTIKVTAFETLKKNLLQITLGMDLSDAEIDEEGELVFDRPQLPIGTQYRLLMIGRDGPANNQWLIGYLFPKVELESAPEEPWGSDALTAELSFKTLADPKAGFSRRVFLGGTALQKEAARNALGFKAKAAAGVVPGIGG